MAVVIAIATDSHDPSVDIDHLAADVMTASNELDDESLLDLVDHLNHTQWMINTKWESMRRLTRGDLDVLSDQDCIIEYIDVCSLLALCNAHGGPSNAMKSAHAARLDALLSRFDGDGEINAELDTIDSLVSVRWRLTDATELAQRLDEKIDAHAKTMAELIRSQ